MELRYKTLCDELWGSSSRRLEQQISSFLTWALDPLSDCIDLPCQSSVSAAVAVAGCSDRSWRRCHAVSTVVRDWITLQPWRAPVFVAVLQGESPYAVYAGSARVHTHNKILHSVCVVPLRAVFATVVIVAVVVRTLEFSRGKYQRTIRSAKNDDGEIQRDTAACTGL